MSPQHIYVDTFLVLGYNDPQKDIKRHSRRVLTKLDSMRKDNKVEIYSPLVVLGEAFEKCCNEGHDSNDLIDVLREMNIQTPAPNEDVYKLAHELMTKDRFFDACDALISAHAIEDQDATWLLTTDPIMLDNRIIQNCLSERGRKMKISDRI